MGWIYEAKEPPLGEFVFDMFVGNRCGWIFVLNGMGVGLGMALISNRIFRGCQRWTHFLNAQTSSSFSDFAQGWTLLCRVLRFALPFAWPLPAVLVTTSLVGIFLLYTAPYGTSSLWMPGSLWDLVFGGVNPKIVDLWKVSICGRVFGIGCDSIAKVIGAFFAIVGMGFGTVLLTSGVNIEPRDASGGEVLK